MRCATSTGSLPSLLRCSSSAGAPYTGQIRGAIQDALPGQYRLIIGGIVVAAVAIAIVSALLRIREQRTMRYGLLALAVGGGALYAWATATGNANVDVVERFHLVEYGALTWLYYRAWQRARRYHVARVPGAGGIHGGHLR